MAEIDPTPLFDPLTSPEMAPPVDGCEPYGAEEKYFNGDWAIVNDRCSKLGLVQVSPVQYWWSWDDSRMGWEAVLTAAMEVDDYTGMTAGEMVYSLFALVKGKKGAGGKAPPPFDLHAKQFFLTYPKCDLSPQLALVQLRNCLPVEKYVIAREDHADGTPHLHVYVRCSSKVRIRSASRLDLLGENKRYHGNYQTARSAGGVTAYCKKGGDYISEGVELGEGDVFAVARDMATSESPAAAVAYLWDKRPRDMAMQAHNITRALGSLYQEVFAPRYTAELFKLPLTLLAKWPSVRSSRSLVLTGLAGCGKTQWARSLEDHLYVTHMDVLGQLKVAHKLIVFDDMDFGHLPRGTVLALCGVEQPAAIHCRYKCAQIPEGVARIFLTNRGAQAMLCGDSVERWDAALQRRISIVEINCKLF